MVRATFVTFTTLLVAPFPALLVAAIAVLLHDVGPV
jgi:hypothetical protein